MPSSYCHNFGSEHSSHRFNLSTAAPSPCRWWSWTSAGLLIYGDELSSVHFFISGFHSHASRVGGTRRGGSSGNRLRWPVHTTAPTFWLEHVRGPFHHQVEWGKKQVCVCVCVAIWWPLVIYHLRGGGENGCYHQLNAEMATSIKTYAPMSFHLVKVFFLL